MGEEGESIQVSLKRCTFHAPFVGTSQTSNSIELAEGNAVSAVTGIGRPVISWIGRYFSSEKV